MNVNTSLHTFTRMAFPYGQSTFGAKVCVANDMENYVPDPQTLNNIKEMAQRIEAATGGHGKGGKYGMVLLNFQNQTKAFGFTWFLSRQLSQCIPKSKMNGRLFGNYDRNPESLLDNEQQIIQYIKEEQEKLSE